VYENTVDVTANTLSDVSCTATASDSVLVKRIEPVIPVSCSDIKDITAVSLIWDGTETVDIVMESGETFLSVQPGNRITFQEANTGNDVTMTIYEAGTKTVIGNSVFHVSCSDADMNGTEDCGKPEGDGKTTDASKTNTWLLDGMDGVHGSFACGLDTIGEVSPESGGGPSAGVVAKQDPTVTKNEFKWRLQNNGSTAAFVTKVEVTWPKEQGNLNELKIDKDKYGENLNALPTSAVFTLADKDFVDDPNKRDLKAGEDKEFKIKFTKDYEGDTIADYKVTFTFSDGSVVSWIGTPGSSPGVVPKQDATVTKNEFKWRLQNNGTTDVLVTEVQVSWPAEQGNLNELKIDKDKYAENLNTAPPPAGSVVVFTEADDFVDDPNKRDLKAGEDKEFKIKFTTDYEGDTVDDYEVTYYFSDGSVVSWP
jgi:uncharacterized cupredoxin-like copper-binding protein